MQAASVSIHGPHGQYIENVHLEPYESEEQFWRSLYERAYSRLLKKAQQFLESTGGKSDETMVFIRYPMPLSFFTLGCVSDSPYQLWLRRFRA